MNDTPHIKRFEEYPKHLKYGHEGDFEKERREIAEAMLNDLASNLELLGGKLIVERVERGRLLRRLDRQEQLLHSVIWLIKNATFPPELNQQIHELFESIKTDQNPTTTVEVN